MDSQQVNIDLIEGNGRYRYYNYTTDSVKAIAGKDVRELIAEEWKTLIQMLYPKNMIASGLFQPIVIFSMKKNGDRKDPPVDAFNSVDELKEGTCLLLRIMDFLKQYNITFHETWDKARNKIEEEPNNE